MIGEIVAGRYRVDAELGRGGMGIVYRAAQLPLERPVALKVLRRELVDDPKARMRFEREARVASALEHPAAVAIYDFGEHEGAAFLVMELLEGDTLAQRIAGAPVGVAVAIELSTQLADVVAAAHAIGLVHRDLKPENAMLTGERLRVLDFGLAFLRAPGPAGRMTREGVVVGTPEYLSPEQARGEDVGPPTDVYAMGCMLHEMLTGQPPFAGAEMDVLTKQMFAPPPALATTEPVPAALDELRRGMLDKVAARRPSADEVRDRLAALDPDPERGRVRARDDGYLGARARRMVDAAPRPEPAPSDTVEIGVVGAVPPSLLIGLSANGFAAFVVSADAAIGAETRALFAPNATEAEIAALAVHGLPVITDADRGDAARLPATLRAGAADVVLRPVTAAELARKLARVVRRR
ncbi:MAG: serine/threonine protein kinase [Sandaracinaceae bacterium]|nr:serine/threonine protein kinase [Sandaracinaceae bacterium]